MKFEVTNWDEDQYVEFYNGDSYIILNTYKDPEGDELKYDVHFWIGKHSTQDEYGTAAYKTVELDTFLDDKPVQHREVQGHESKLFKSYFEGNFFMIFLLKNFFHFNYQFILEDYLGSYFLMIYESIAVVPV